MKKPQFFLWICIIIFFLVGVQILFSIPAPCKWLEAVWDAGDFISFVGTISLGIVAVYQTRKANEISSRLLQIDEERRRPQIDIRAISEDKLKQYNRQQLISSSVEGIYINVDFDWREDVNAGDNFWFEIKNIRDMDIINVQPVTVTSQIVDSNGACIISDKYCLLTSCNLNMIQGNDTAPFLLGMSSTWAKVAEHPNQSLLLSLEFKIMNSDGEEYVQRISLHMVNAHNSRTLTPVIINKKVYKSELIKD